MRLRALRPGVHIVAVLVAWVVAIVPLSIVASVRTILTGPEAMLILLGVGLVMSITVFATRWSLVPLRWVHLAWAIITFTAALRAFTGNLLWPVDTATPLTISGILLLGWSSFAFLCWMTARETSDGSSDVPMRSTRSPKQSPR
jgi:hypothetical protein